MGEWVGFVVKFGRGLGDGYRRIGGIQSLQYVNRLSEEYPIDVFETAQRKIWCFQM